MISERAKASKSGNLEAVTYAIYYRFTPMERQSAKALSILFSFMPYNDFESRR